MDDLKAAGSAKRIHVPGVDAPVAVVGPGAEFEGLLVIQGPAQIDGRISGEILSDETLWIGKDAQIDANITAVNVIVAGTVHGEVRASGRIALESTARVTGDLSAERLVLIEGSQVEGSCHAGDSEPASS